MKAKTVVAVRERESYTLVNKSEAFLACLKNANKVYVTYNTFKLNIYKFNKIAFFSMPNISRYA
ncbi:MAG: hypothetical protein IJH76_05575 [Clostridia bacterium]|nr:hypothetical protein [Clostridia bacterium]